MVLLWVISNIIIMALRVALFTIFAKCSKDIFFILYLSILVLLSNTFSLLKCICNGPRPESYSRPPAGIYPWLEPPSFLVNSGQP